MHKLEQTGSAARLTAFGVFCGLTWLLGVLAKSSLVLSLGQALLLLALLHYLAVRAALSGLACRRDCPSQATEGERIVVRLSLDNRSLLPAYLVELADRFPADRQPRKAALLASIGPRERGAAVEYEACCSAGRGVYVSQQLELAAADPLGLFRVRRRIALPHELVVLPRPLEGLSLDPPGLWRGAGGQTRELAQVGQTTCPAGAREHRGAAPLRHVHWRASARRDRLVLKEYEAGVGAHWTVFLDLSPEGRPAVEWAIRAAAAIGRQAALEGARLQLVADDGAPVVLPARDGRRHYLTLLDLLARLRDDGRTPLLELLRRGTPLVPEGGTLILPLGHAGLDFERLAALRARWRRRAIGPLALLLDRPEAAGALDETQPLLQRLDIPAQRVACVEPALR